MGNQNSSSKAQTPKVDPKAETQPQLKSSTDAAPAGGGVEGEGSYTATHNYNAGLKKSIDEGKSDELAQKAKQALDGPEGDELRKAEAEGKSHRADVSAKPTTEKSATPNRKSN